MRQLRKGEALLTDKRPRDIKQQNNKKLSRTKWLNGFWKSQARKRCEERLAHYESTGNEWKASIYRRKLGK